MAALPIKIPDIGDFSEVEVIEILVAVGDRVQREQPLLTLESDKATMDIPAPTDGTIAVLHISVGDKVAEGTLVMEITADEDSPVAKPTDAQPEMARPDTPVTAEPGARQPLESEPPTLEIAADTANAGPPSGHLPYASPGIRQFARELGVDLRKVTGSGPKQRILKADVKAWIKSELTARAATPSPSESGIPPIPAVDFAEFGELEYITLSRIKRLSGPHLHRAWINIPHVTHHDEADITNLEQFRKSLKPESEAQGFRVTILPFVMKALVAALKQFPTFNASLSPDGQALILKKYFNIGIAVDTRDGLVVPVIRAVDRKSIFDLAAELSATSERARNAKLKSEDLKGGCISISSLGGIGGCAFTPVINAPEVAILGISRAKMAPFWDGTAFQPRLMLPLDLSYDHRVIDGAEAARFCAYLVSVFGDIRRLTL